jgi:hypothetical protein
MVNLYLYLDNLRPLMLGKGSHTSGDLLRNTTAVKPRIDTLVPKQCDAENAKSCVIACLDWLISLLQILRCGAK